MDTLFIADETTVAPTAEINGWSQPIYFTDDQIMLKDYFGLGSTGQYVSYAFTYFTVPASQSAELWVGSDEALKIYLNEQLVYNYTGTRIFAGTDWYKDTSTILNLKAGINKLLVKAYQSTGTYNFSLNICEPADLGSTPAYRGNRVAGLKFTNESGPTYVSNKNPQIRASFELYNCYPNPFNPVTTIRYTVPDVGTRHAVSLRVFDLLGREVATLVDEQKQAGTFSVPWDASKFASGIYFYKLTAEKYSQTKKMVLIK